MKKKAKKLGAVKTKKFGKAKKVKLGAVKTDEQYTKILGGNPTDAELRDIIRNSKLRASVEAAYRMLEGRKKAARVAREQG